MAKPIFIMHFGGRLPDAVFDAIEKRLAYMEGFTEEYHVVIVDGEPNGGKFMVLNGDHEDIQDIETYLKELKDGKEN